jgi:predicted nucleic acid-binding protein
MTDCLDSWAVLAWLVGDEPAASVVDNVMADRPIMSWINLGEVAYITERRQGAETSRRLVIELRPRLRLDQPTPSRVLEAARIKAAHTVAYADAFAVATALAHGATLLTGDPEILGGDPTWPILNLRG